MIASETIGPDESYSSARTHEFTVIPYRAVPTNCYQNLNIPRFAR